MSATTVEVGMRPATIDSWHFCNGREEDPAHMSAWDLRVHIASERAGGWNPVHYVPPTETRVESCCGTTTCSGGEPVCETFAGVEVGDTYGFTHDRAIYERWYGAGWGCQDCAEVLHS